MKPKIAVTMGDPAGVGPELCLQLCQLSHVTTTCAPLIFGNAAPLQAVAEELEMGLLPPIVSLDEFLQGRDVQQATIVDCGDFDMAQLTPGAVNAGTGEASFRYINAAIDCALARQVDAIATCPINKEAWQQAGIQYPGHTELFAERGQSDRFCMMMTAPQFSCSLVTTHVGYHEVPSLLNVDRILEVIQLTNDSLQKICGRQPQLLALGLNPHAGEGGLFGNQEEEKFIVPAVEAARKMGIEIAGPLPPDTAFLPWRREETDGYVCMYHDQGLIPFKALNFDTGVNITLGLESLVRTSVDHGTALDIAWAGRADVSSLVSAVKLAERLV